MRIDRLELEHFKGFTNARFDFCPGFNLCIGRNGQGKTAILDALAVATGSLLLGFPSPAKTRTISNREIHVKKITQGQVVSWEPQLPCKVSATGSLSVLKGGDLEPVSLKWCRSVTSPSLKTTYGAAKAIIDLSRRLQKAVAAGEEQPLPLIAYYGTGRLWLQKQEQTKPDKGPSRFFGYNNCLDPASDEKAFFRWYKNVAWEDFNLRASDEEPHHLKQAVDQAIIQAVERCEGIDYIPKRQAVCARFSDGRDLPLQYFSDGERNMIGMIADMAYRAAVLNPFFGAEAAQKTPGVVLIDELDLHLHPEWQQTVVAQLKRTFPKVQFIATSHSPFIIQSITKADRILSLDNARGNTEDVAHMGVEEIASEWQGVAQPERSKHYFDQIDAAEVYFEKLEEAKSAPHEQRPALMEELDRLMDAMERRGYDAAYQASLRLERKAAGLWRSQ